MTENWAFFNARHGVGSFHPHRQPEPTVQACLKRGKEASWRTTRQLSGECRFNTRGNGLLDGGQNASGPVFRLNEVENFAGKRGDEPRHDAAQRARS